MKTFRQISLYVGEFEYLNRQREEAASRLQTGRTRESELQRQSANVQTNGLNHAVLNAQLAGARDATMRFQARVNDLELLCNDKKRAIREHMRRFNRLNVCVIRSCDDFTALRRLLTWLDPASARPIRYKLGKGKVAPALLEGIELWARLLEIELPAGRDTVIEGQPVGGDVFIPGDV